MSRSFCSAHNQTYLGRAYRPTDDLSGLMHLLQYTYSSAKTQQKLPVAEFDVDNHAGKHSDHHSTQVQACILDAVQHNLNMDSELRMTDRCTVCLLPVCLLPTNPYLTATAVLVNPEQQHHSKLLLPFHLLLLLRRLSFFFFRISPLSNVRSPGLHIPAPLQALQAPVQHQACCALCMLGMLGMLRRAIRSRQGLEQLLSTCIGIEDEPGVNDRPVCLVETSNLGWAKKSVHEHMGCNTKT